MFNWNILIIIATVFGLFYAYIFYTVYRDTEEKKRPKLIVIYGIIAIISVFALFGAKPVGKMLGIVTEERQTIGEEYQPTDLIIPITPAR